MGSELFFPAAWQLEAEHLQIGPGGMTINVVSAASSAFCPACGWYSSRTRGAYTRTLHDLAWLGRRVNLNVTVPRFSCGNPDCTRQTFAGPLAGLTQPHARRTSRQIESLRAIGFAAGGEAGSRLAGTLGMAVSPDTLLRLIRRAPPPAVSVPRILGVDDWAWRRGHHYGTILCDLEQHRPVDLLRDRSAEVLADWLKLHPSVELISRDRGAEYARGATAGAPQAQQVADRWHLLHNLHEAVVRAMDRYYRDVREVANEIALSRAPPDQPIATPPMEQSALPVTQSAEIQQTRRSRRMERYEQVVALQNQGISLRAIGHRLGLHRSTVRRFVRAGQFPERATRNYSSRLDSFMKYVRQRWEAGCHNALQITHELKEQGFAGDYTMVRRRVAHWRKSLGEMEGTRLPPMKDHKPVRTPSSNQVAWLLTKNEQEWTAEDKAFTDALLQRCPELKVVSDLIHEFADLLRKRQAAGLEGWMARVNQPGVPKEVRNFAYGLLSDYGAVKAAFELEWSNGQVEGQVNRLKLIKRTMYGRAGFDLLRQRVLHIG